VGASRLASEELARNLVVEHGTALLWFVQRLARGDRQLAEDIVQETLLRAWRHARDLPADAVRPWLFTTARHLVIDNYRARSVRPAEVSPDQIEATAVVDDLDDVLDAVLVADALSALSPAHRAVLIDCFYRGRTAAEIAMERGLPPGTARSRIHYAMRAMLLALQERGVTQP
jgi:RNA polymerase sigma-70 factor, ECF subfamily